MEKQYDNGRGKTLHWVCCYRLQMMKGWERLLKRSARQRFSVRVTLQCEHASSHAGQTVTMHTAHYR